MNKAPPVPQAGHITSLKTAIALVGVGVKYRLLTDVERTLKGRLLSVLGRSRSPAAEFWALRKISLTLEQGQVIGILGRNGSGKSTLLRVISGIIAPSEGKVSTTGRVSPVLDLTGMMNPELTGRANAFLHGALHRIPRQRMKELIPQVVEFAELGPFFDVPLKAYSSGMVARLAFGLATQLNPEILLIDEALAVGDEQFQRKSFFRMRKLIEKGSLVVIVSHNTSLLEQLCNRVILIDGGRIVADGEAPGIIGQYRRSLH